MKNRTEFKKIALAFIVVFALAYITIGRCAELFGLIVDTSVDVALVYCVIGAFASYCVASATDKYGMNKYGQGAKIGVDYEEGDGTE
ncbi:hypothetical protein IJI69_00330 [Candidatus Saccharibacteria bacterium]|nr:hypothetical protein [Candidatus Saccharibacteria bacterium]MBQ6127135.1 hypothetical protein [Candidatus Saccharibacteria bacterium]